MCNTQKLAADNLPGHVRCLMMNVLLGRGEAVRACNAKVETVFAKSFLSLFLCHYLMKCCLLIEIDWQAVHDGTRKGTWMSSLKRT
jgi:hypothetical protein